MFGISYAWSWDKRWFAGVLDERETYFYDPERVLGAAIGAAMGSGRLDYMRRRWEDGIFKDGTAKSRSMGILRMKSLYQLVILSILPCV